MQTKQYQHSFLECGTNVVQIKDAQIEYRATFIENGEAWRLYQKILEETQWRQESVTVYGKQHLTPRLSCWMGESWMDYSYSNTTMVPLPWTALLFSLKELIESATNEAFNSVLINYYRDGRDSNGWHSDDEPELGVDPVIASLSLGAARDFHMRHKTEKGLKHTMSLEHGSLLMMRGATQRCWQHHIPKRAKAEGRINLTFRSIKPRSQKHRL